MGFMDRIRTNDIYFESYSDWLVPNNRKSGTSALVF
jgi:hypothetical protein